MEPVTVVAALGSITHLTNIAKTIGGYLKDTGKAEAMEQLMDLNSAILDLQQKHAELFQENQALKEENRQLKQKRDLRAELQYVEGVYRRIIGDQKEYYCPNCLDSAGKYVRIQRDLESDGPKYWCTTCQGFFRPA